MMQPGFHDPVLDAQSGFRAVLEAMSRPGRVQALPPGLTPPAPLQPATAAVLLTLADAETPVFSDAGTAAAEWLRFHAGCPLVASPAAATFLCVTGTPPALEEIGLGTDEAPQDGATLVLQVAALREGGALRLSGPGIEREHRLHVEGLPEGFLAARAALAPLYPRGMDVILCAGTRIAALPRTTHVMEG